METEKIKKMINEYFDNELTGQEEMLLFAGISENNEAREYFKSMNLLQNKIEDSKEEFPLHLEEKIFANLNKSTVNAGMFSSVKSYLAVASYAVSVILLVVSLYLFNETKDYKQQIETNSAFINSQEETINLLMNTMPVVKVSPDYNNEVIVNSQL